MQKSAPIRVGLLAVLGVGGAGWGQGLPVTSPTAVEAPKPPAAKSAGQQPAQRAQVQYEMGILSIRADNSSLNQILREVGRVSGMKITGGVSDERVYGTYGPGDPSSVLGALLKGTGSNMLLVLDARQDPKELVLTPRNGGPTPPNPSASRDADMVDMPPQRVERGLPMDRAFPQGRPMPPQQQPQAQPDAQAAPPPAAPPTAPAGDTTTQQSPNAVKTPQEIYQQLIQMQQQQQKTPPQ